MGTVSGGGGGSMGGSSGGIFGIPKAPAQPKPLESTGKMSIEVQAVYLKIFEILQSHAHEYLGGVIMKIVYLSSGRIEVYRSGARTITITLDHENVKIVGIQNAIIELNEPNSIEKLSNVLLATMAASPRT